MARMAESMEMVGTRRAKADLPFGGFLLATGLLEELFTGWSGAFLLEG